MHGAHGADMDESRARTVRRGGVALAVIGVVLVLAGAAGLALDGGNDETVTSARRRPVGAATTTTPTVAPTTTTTLSPRAKVEAFFADWANALRTGDASFLVARLHPAVPQRYGDDSCRAYLGSLRFPQASAQVLSVDAATATWSWETDGRTSAIADAFGLRLRRTEDGTSFTEAPAHIAFVNGEVRWFTDCGTPKES
jgi:hypothetical protein